MSPLDQLKWMLKMQTAPSETAAVIIEPILGVRCNSIKRGCRVHQLARLRGAPTRTPCSSAECCISQMRARALLLH